MLSLAKDDKEREWIKKKAHTVPTHSMYALAQMLKEIGIDIIQLVNYALDLHEYQYNGFEPGFSKYSRKEDVLKDLATVIKETEKAVITYFPKVEIKEIYEKIDKALANLISQT